MNKKIQNLKEMEYCANFNLVGEVILKLRKKNPENETIRQAVEAMTQIGFYVNELMSNQYYYEQSLSEYRSDKLRAVERARKAEAHAAEIEKKYTLNFEK